MWSDIIISNTGNFPPITGEGKPMKGQFFELITPLYIN